MGFWRDIDVYKRQGKWFAVTNDGKLEEDWKNPEKQKNLKKLGGIMRTPTFVNKGRRVIVPFHNRGGGTKFHISCLLYTSRCV